MFKDATIQEAVSRNGNDEIVWPLNSKGSFIVKSFCSTQHAALEGRDVAAKSIC